MRAADVVVVIAGADGALASVIAGVSYACASAVGCSLLARTSARLQSTAMLQMPYAHLGCPSSAMHGIIPLCTCLPLALLHC